MKLCKALNGKSYWFCFSELRRPIEILLAISLLILSSLFIYIYFDQLSEFFLKADPAYRWAAIFSLCFIGTTSVIVPIPYTAVILNLTVEIPDINLLEIAIWGGLGSGLGEVIGWIAGFYFSRKVRDSKFGRRIDIISNLAKTKSARFLIPLVVFAFAFTFLPDDVIFIILGAINYDPLHTITASIAGKICMLYAIGTFGSLIGKMTSYLPDWVTMIITLAIFLTFLLLVEFVDWESLIQRYLGATEDKSESGGSPMISARMCLFYGRLRSKNGSLCFHKKS